VRAVREAPAVGALQRLLLRGNRAGDRAAKTLAAALTCAGAGAGAGAGGGGAGWAAHLWEVRAPLPLLRTNRTRRVPHPVLSGHAASLTPY
jgi:hypothetical protein